MTILTNEVVCVPLAGSLLNLHALVIGHDDSTRMTILVALVAGRVRPEETETGITAAAAFSNENPSNHRGILR